MNEKLLRGEAVLQRVAHHAWRAWRQALKRDDYDDAVAWNAARDTCDDLHLEIKRELKSLRRQERQELKLAA
jgi:hypothetical protein